MKRRSMYERAFPLDDIEVSRSGDGRTVTAYAAMFGSPYEVRDEHGHYFEEISRAAFDRFLGRGIERVLCLWNHGLTAQHTPSDRFSMPLGTPLEVKPDGRGLLTVTRYAKTDLADEALELIRSGAVTTQSFRGPIYASDRPRPHASGLSLIARTQLGLRDYGPAPMAVNAAAEILSVRSVADLTEEIAELTETERAELLAALDSSTSPTDPGPTGTSPSDPDPHLEPGDDVAPSSDGPSVDAYDARAAALRLRANS